MTNQKCSKNPDTCESIPPGTCCPDCHGWEKKKITLPRVKFVVCSTSDDGYDSSYQEFYSRLEAKEAAKQATHEYSSEVILYEVRLKRTIKSKQRMV